MVEEVRASLSNGRRAFEANVQDQFGRSICQEVYEPFDAELGALQAAVEEAHSEQQAIQNLLLALRAIV